uniref:Uncharacterized protein n=1 Tax=Triticum urartu TaxID=4572 RepID=A0A8R7QQ57_TRIUA
MGCPSCCKTAPTPYSHASVSMTKGLVKSGKASVGVVTKAVFNASKASPVADVHWKGVLLRSKSVRGRAIVPN